MAKAKVQFVCQSCGAGFPKWSGNCPDCHEWNTLVETLYAPSKKNDRRAGGYAGANSQARAIGDIESENKSYFSSGYHELDRVLGDGVVNGSVVLIGGDPGIGKSTLLLQMLSHLGSTMPVLYITGEESLQQVSLRAGRAHLINDSNKKQLMLLAETQIEQVLAVAQQEQPRVMVVDSIQTVLPSCCLPRLVAFPRFANARPNWCALPSKPEPLYFWWGT